MTRTPVHFDRRRDNSAPSGHPLCVNPTRTTRLLFSPSSFSGVDGVWWPRTQNLTVELPDLVAGLAAKLGPVGRVHFDWNAISALQRHIDSHDGLIVGGREPGQPSRVMRLYGRNGTRADLAVVEPGIDTAYGYRFMRRITDTEPARTRR